VEETQSQSQSPGEEEDKSPGRDEEILDKRLQLRVDAETF